MNEVPIEDKGGNPILDRLLGAGSRVGNNAPDLLEDRLNVLWTLGDVIADGASGCAASVRLKRLPVPLGQRGGLEGLRGRKGCGLVILAHFR